MCTKATQEYAGTLTEYMREYDEEAGHYNKYLARENLLATIEEYLISRFAVENFINWGADGGYPGDDCCALYDGRDFSGLAVTVCLGTHPDMVFNFWTHGS